MNKLIAPPSAAYQLGYRNGKQQFYWTWQYNRDLGQQKTAEAMLDFYNGYHDALADKYGQERAKPRTLTETPDLNDLYMLP